MAITTIWDPSCAAAGPRLSSRRSLGPPKLTRLGLSQVIYLTNERSNSFKPRHISTLSTSRSSTSTYVVQAMKKHLTQSFLRSFRLLPPLHSFSILPNDPPLNLIHIHITQETRLHTHIFKASSYNSSIHCNILRKFAFWTMKYRCAVETILNSTRPTLMPRNVCRMLSTAHLMIKVTVFVQTDCLLAKPAVPFVVLWVSRCVLATRAGGKLDNGGARRADTTA